jgi:hypothetical protein
MFEVMLWQPNRGWLLVLRTRSARKAHKMARDLAPYEVQVTASLLDCSGERYYKSFDCGKPCMVDHDSSAVKKDTVDGLLSLPENMEPQGGKQDGRP